MAFVAKGRASCHVSDAKQNKSSVRRPRSLQHTFHPTTNWQRLTMILRKYPISLLSVFLVFSFAVAQNDSDSGFDCHLSVDSFKYDLTTLAGERTLSRTRDTPPTVM